jgi:hypothetical protein
MHIARQRARNAQLAFDERPIDLELCLVICDLLRSPGLDLLPEGVEVPLNAIDADGQRIDNREILADWPA